jgi:hypothetical protein
LVLGTSLALLALAMRVRLEEQQREIRRARLGQLLDGVTAETLARLARDPRFPGVPPRAEGAGRGWTQVERVRPGVVRIEATASLGARRARATVLALVAPGTARILEWRRGPPGAGSAAEPLQ